MSERFDWPQTRSAVARLKDAWADLLKACEESRAENRRLRAVILISKALEIDRIEAAAMCCLIADAVREKLAEEPA